MNTFQRIVAARSIAVLAMLAAGYEWCWGGNITASVAWVVAAVGWHCLDEELLRRRWRDREKEHSDFLAGD